MKYKFINQVGYIIETNNLNTIKKGLTWDRLNYFKPLWSLYKKDVEFLNKYGLSHSIFNVGCLHNLNMVYLNEFDYKRIKGGINK